MQTAPQPLSRDSAIARNLLVGSLGCTLLISSVMILQPFYWSRGIGTDFWMIVSLSFLAPIMLLRYFKDYLLRKPAWTGWMLTVAVVNLLVILPELALRAVDFRYGSGLRIGYRQGYFVPGGQFISLIPDERLGYKVSPEDFPVNSLGFPYKEVSTSKPPGTFRILYLGDSCTQQGYPLLAELFLNAAHPQKEKQFEGVNLALSGYTSYQGRVISDLYGLQLDPDLVFVYFGWNDLWRAHGGTDAEMPVPSSLQAGTQLFQESRLAQGILKMIVELSGLDDRDILKEVRVPPASYRENLRTIKSIFDQKRIPVVFITGPTSHYKLGVPNHLLEQKYILDKEELISMHRHYNQISRDVAQETGAYLLDLESEFNELRDLKQIFLPDDGFHFTPDGLVLVAKRVTDFTEREVLLHQH